MHSTWLCCFHQDRNGIKIARSDNFNILAIQFCFWNIFDILSKWNFGIYFLWQDFVAIVNFEVIISKSIVQSSWLCYISRDSTKMCELSEFKMLNYFVSINSQSDNIKAFDQKVFIDKQQSATTHQKNQAKWSEIATINRSWCSSSCLYLMGTWHIHTKTDSS